MAATDPPIFTIRWIDGQCYQEAPSQGGPHQRAFYRCSVAPIMQKKALTAAVVDGIIREALDKAEKQISRGLRDGSTIKKM